MANKTWEDVFTEWSKAPPDSEQERSENAIRAIMEAIAKSERLKKRHIKTYAQGSYRDQVNVRDRRQTGASSASGQAA